MTTLEVGNKLVELCRQNKNIEAVKTLYAPNVVSIEPMSGPNMPARQDGIDKAVAKNEWWVNSHTVHSSSVSDPYPHGDRFIVRFVYDVTGKSGPMAGKRINLDETGLYTVKDGKVTQEEFFYDMSKMGG